MTGPVRTTCPYCGVGCGILAAPDGKGGALITGDPDHPANFGRLCSKGAALGDTLDLDDRLLQPEVDGVPQSWPFTLDSTAERLQAIISAHGPEAVAFYVSGQLLTEDYYAANKLLKGFIGSPHLDTNSRLCMASAVAGYRRAFGSDAVPCSYEDIEASDLVLIVGSNLAWCHPVLFQRLLAEKQRRPELRVVCIDPRRTVTADAADLHLPLRAGQDVRLFQGLLVWLADHGGIRPETIAATTTGFGAALEAARTDAGDFARLAAECGVAADQLRQLCEWLAAAPRFLTLFSQGVNQSSAGTDKVNAIINLHLATGQIGRLGAGPFSVTGQPNAMGGREVGALSNQLAAHMNYDDPADVDRVRRFWDAPALPDGPGHKAVDLIAAIERGEIKALWVMATNPAVSLPDAGRVRKALAKLPLLIVSDCMRRTDTADLAQIRLPALAWGEKDGTVTNSERRISRQRAFLSAPENARPDWWILQEVAKRLGHGAAFRYNGSVDILREHAALSGFENTGRRAFDISAWQHISDEDYAGLNPAQWPLTEAMPAGTARLFTDQAYFFPDRKARFVAVRHRAPGAAANAEHAFLLNTGRVRDQWHTMTRTGKSPRLSQHRSVPFAELHPSDMALLGLRPGMLVEVRSGYGTFTGRCLPHDGQQRGTVFVPMHWNDQFAADAAVNGAVNPITDPVSGQPEFKHTPVRLRELPQAWYGYALSRQPLSVPMAGWWARSRGEAHWRFDLAGTNAITDANGEMQRELQRAHGREEDLAHLEYADPASGIFRHAWLLSGQVQAVLFLAPNLEELPDAGWLAQLFGLEVLTPADRRSLLSGRGQDGGGGAGPVVCACFGVGRNTLQEAIAQQQLRTASAVGACLKAGTNCGSCLPEITALLAEAKAVAA